MIRLVATLLLVSATFAASASNFIEPEPGWWYNSSEPGYGFDIEQQSDQLLVGIFAYDQSGNPTWYTASGHYDNVHGIFSGQAQQWGNGPCLGCNYVPPSVASSPATVTITFIDRSHATVSWNGKSFPITRFSQGWPDQPSKLLGGWNITTSMLTGSLMPIGDLLNFYQTGQANSLPAIRGCRILSPEIPATGYFYTAQDMYAVIVDTPASQIPGSQNTYTYYEFHFEGLNKIRGSVWIVPFGSTPNGSGSQMVGYRTVQNVGACSPPTTTDLPPFKSMGVSTSTTMPATVDARFQSVLNLLQSGN